MKQSLILCLALTLSFAQAQVQPSVEEIIKTLTPPPTETPTLDIAANNLTTPPPLPLSPPEHKPYLEALQKIVISEPNVKLTRLLMDYQIAYPNPDNDFTARILGLVYLEQTDTFLRVFDNLSRQDKLRIVPYLTFGWEQAVKGKNLSIPRISDKAKRLDRLKAALINP